MGVWIETKAYVNTLHNRGVTPFVGVWIETSKANMVESDFCVTPFVGVWIETEISPCFCLRRKSHPSWVCGLKQRKLAHKYKINASHPSWVCGLKHYVVNHTDFANQSHPSWVCGLKLLVPHTFIKSIIVTPFVGVWIETKATGKEQNNTGVTPFVGVWIETSH